MIASETEARSLLGEHGQEHLLRFWDRLNEQDRRELLDQVETIDFGLMNRLAETWIHNEPAPETFERIEPVPTLPPATPNDGKTREARDAGEEALRTGRVGLLLVAGGQGTRLGFDGPKGAYPIGPVTEKSFFEFHAEKIRNLQCRYACILPWYIMVSEANGAATEAFFQQHRFFGLEKKDVVFFRQGMVPCMDADGKFLLDALGHIAMNPNGHGGSIPAVVEKGIARDCHERGIDTLSYFQVDNWAVKVADPVFLGHHLLRGGEMSSKNHRKNEAREAVGVHCICDGQYRVIEYSALDIYPQLLEEAADGSPRYYAGNPAIHALGVEFIERVYADYAEFPWWRAHKKIPHLNAAGELIQPEKPNAFKFETFVFDALRFIRHAPIALEIHRMGEYTPIKQFEGKNSVQAAWKSMGIYWAAWLEAAGCSVPRNSQGDPAIPIEISPAFALTQEEFVEKANGKAWNLERSLAIGPDGRQSEPVTGQAAREG